MLKLSCFVQVWQLLCAESYPCRNHIDSHCSSIREKERKCTLLRESTAKLSGTSFCRVLKNCCLCLSQTSNNSILPDERAAKLSYHSTHPRFIQSAASLWLSESVSFSRRPVSLSQPLSPATSYIYTIYMSAATYADLHLPRRV